MKNIKLGHALRLYVDKKVFSQKILGVSKTIGVLSPLYLVIDKFECSFHICRGPWIITYLGQNRPRKVPTGVTILRKVDAISAHF